MSNKVPKSYLPKMKKILLIFLRRRFDEDQAQMVYKKIQEIDKKYREEEPYIGGKDNLMADNLYESYAMFALYEALGRSLNADDINELINIYYEEKTAKLPKNFNIRFLVNSRFLKNIVYKYFGHYAKKANKKKGNERNNTWGIELNPQNEKEGFSMNLVGCPLYDFAKKHEMLDILPLMCNLDHRISERFGLKLYRDKTVSNGDSCCAYYLYDNRSKKAEEFVNELNSKGLIISKHK